MRASVSVQKISASTMKVLGIISMFLACVAARGSGPYLPSGWKPDGPAFYLPSEASKPFDATKEVTFSESEASGSDSLREYGPPKVQQASQEVLQQGLPDVVNDKLFIERIIENNVETNAEKNSNTVIDITEQKNEVKAEVKAVEESLAVTELVPTTATETILYNVEEAVEIKDETTTLADAVGSGDAVYELGYVVEPTEAIVVPTEKVNLETTTQLENQVLTVKLEQESDQSDSHIEESAESRANNEQLNVNANEQASNDEIETSVTQQPDIGFVIISTVEKKVDEVDEEVKKVENVAQNIPELIVSLENEIAPQQVQSIQEIPAIVQEKFGSIDQVPEGFLEYGPPGFSEYGPPKEDLTLNTIEEKTSEIQPIENDISRRRRFSPKFKSTGKSN